MGKWRGRDDVPIQEQVQSIGILSYSAKRAGVHGDGAGGRNLSGEPLQVAKVATDEFEPKEPPEDTTPVTVELVPVGNSGVRGKITLRPYEYQQVGQDNWYRCYGTIKVTGLAGMDETVIAYLSSAGRTVGVARVCLLRPVAQQVLLKRRCRDDGQRLVHPAVRHASRLQGLRWRLARRPGQDAERRHLQHEDQNPARRRQHPAPAARRTLNSQANSCRHQPDL